MATRYIVRHGFYHTFAHEIVPTWITRENADRVADIAPAERDHLIETGVITAVPNAPDAAEQPFLSAPEPSTAPEPTHAKHAASHAASHSKRKGGE